MFSVFHVIALLLFLAPFLALFYRHVRNGLFQKNWPAFLQGDTASRIFWGLALNLSFSLANNDWRVWPALAFFVSGQISIRVTHGYIMDCGRHPVPEKKWPSFFMPQHTQAEWDAMTPTDRAIYDGIQGACVGFVRGLISFLPLLFFGYHAAPIVAAISVLTVGTPLCYALGYLTPYDVWGVKSFTPEWGEVYHGPMFAIALLLLG
jgi:hypothetical protein